MINLILLDSNATSFGIAFWIPIIITIGLGIWNGFQQIKITGLKKENEKHVFIHQLQFEKEFEIYKEVWENLVYLRSAVAGLRPELSNSDITIEKRVERAAKRGQETITIVEKNKPFFAKNVYKRLHDVLDKVRQEIVEAEGGDMNTKEYWEDSSKKLNEIVILIDKVCDAIRERVGLKEK